MISSTPATGGAPLMAAMTLKNTPNPSVTIMPPLSFITHAPGVGGHGAVPRAVAGGVWTPDLWSVPSSPVGSVWDVGQSRTSAYRLNAVLQIATQVLQIRRRHRPTEGHRVPIGGRVPSADETMGGRPRPQASTNQGA